ncbi:hypothetical protein ACHQM5_013438 [Ranunculus cassubicifolius]
MEIEEQQHHTNLSQDESKKKKTRKLKNKQQQQIDEPDIQIDSNHKKSKKKKRKHGEDDPVPISKGIEMKIELIQDRKEKIAPLVGYFPSGFDPIRNNSGEDDDDEEEENGNGGVEIRTFRRKDRPNRLKLVVSPKGGSSVNFVGSSHSGEAAASQICTYALCVVDKETQTLKIVPIASNKILRLEPIVGGSDLQPKELLNGEVLTPAERAAKQRVLQEKYGTKKATTKDRKMTELNRKEDEKTQKVIDDKVNEVEVNMEALQATNGTPARNIPPHDSTADTPEKAYPLDQIILEGEWNYLPDITEFMGETTLTVGAGYPRFVCNRLDKLRQIQDEDEKYKLAGIYSYITQLIRFKDQNKEHRNAPYFIKKFSGMFADSSSKFPPPEKKDYLISYVMVLTLIAEGYETDTNDIGMDLKLGTGDRRRHWENLGGKLKKNAKTKKFDVCVLPVPLTFPQQQMRRRRR